jgi:hypothetical protein
MTPDRALQLLIAFVALLTVVIFVSEIIVPHLDPPDHKPRRRVH